MHLLDWAVVVAYLVWIVWDGLRRSKATNAVEGYFLANRSLPWWAVGLSVMATQLSAITLVGTTGRGYAEGLSIVQLYLGLPIAMVILSMTLVPFFYRAKVFTAYEYLERRFDSRTRTLASLLFLMSRALSCGVIIAAPAVILSIVLGWNLTLTILGIGVPTVLYTMVGGVQAVTWTDVKQMVVIVAGVGAAVAVLLFQLPDHVSVGEALHIAGATGRMQALDFTWDPNKTYTFWSGLIGGLFLMLSYFGCDQSQVQRYLTAKSVKEGRQSLMMSAYFKIPLQFLIPMIGVLIFVFYLFHQPPVLFNRQHDAEVRASARAGEYLAMEQEFAAAFDARRDAASALAAARRSGSAGTLGSAEGAFRDADGRAMPCRDCRPGCSHLGCAAERAEGFEHVVQRRRRVLGHDQVVAGVQRVIVQRIDVRLVVVVFDIQLGPLIARDPHDLDVHAAKSLDQLGFLQRLLDRGPVVQLKLRHFGLLAGRTNLHGDRRRRAGCSRRGRLRHRQALGAARIHGRAAGEQQSRHRRHAHLPETSRVAVQHHIGVLVTSSRPRRLAGTACTPAALTWFA